MEISLGELARTTGAELHGDAGCIISHVATLQTAECGSISFLTNRKYKRFLPITKASAVILKRSDLASCPVSALICENVHVTYAQIAGLLAPSRTLVPGVHPSAVVDPTSQIAPSAEIGPRVVIAANVSIGERCYIGPGCVIQADASIGDESRLLGNATVCYGVRLGKRVLVQPGAVIGSDGFGFAFDGVRWIKVPQLGSVTIGDDVEVGSNCTIDRGALEDTLIGNGVKLDNLIQIAHNVRIGAHTIIAGCAAIAGSATIGEYCSIGGAAKILGHLEIADHVTITVNSLVSKSITVPGSIYSSGIPSVPNELWNRTVARIKHLDELAKRVINLEKRLAQVEKK